MPAPEDLRAVRDARRPVLALRRTARFSLRPPLRAPRRALRATLRLTRRTVRRAPALRRATLRFARPTLRLAVRRTRRAAERRRTLPPDFLFAMLVLRMLTILKLTPHSVVSCPQPMSARRRRQSDKREAATCGEVCTPHATVQ